MAESRQQDLPTLARAALVREAVAKDLSELQRVGTGAIAYNQRWLAQQISGPCGIGEKAAQNCLTPDGPFPVKPNFVRVRLQAIQDAFERAFHEERSNGPTGPHDYMLFLAEDPTPEPRRPPRFPAVLPQDHEAPATESVPSARIDELFRLVASELQPDPVNRYLREILQRADALEDQAARHAVRARASAALAVEAETAGDRHRLWQEALRASKRELAEAPGLDAVRRRALIAVDATSDRFAAFELNECQHVLAGVAQDLDAVLLGSEKAHERSALLAVKATILRNRGARERLPSPRHAFLDEGIRCANAAIKAKSLPAALLEMGLSLSQRSGTTNDLERRQELVGEAEHHLIRAIEEGAGELGRLALASFYRHVHRPLDAVDAFPLEGPHANYRRVLRTAPVFAEAAIELYYNGYPDGVVEQALEDARVLLEEAHRGGYGWARHLVDLIMVRGLLDDAWEHEGVLAELFDETGGTDWTHISRLASSPAESLTQESFALGVDDSAVWNRLGTFALDVLCDDVHAERMYRQSIRLASNPYLPRTNLARLLIHRGEPSDLREARKLLEGSSSAPPTFLWWRRERDRLADAVAKLPPDEQFPAPRPKPSKLAARATAARTLDDPIEGRRRIAQVVEALIDQSSLPRTGELAVMYRAGILRFDVLWCPPENEEDSRNALGGLDGATGLLVVLSHVVTESIETGIRDTVPGVVLVTAPELDAVANGLEQLPTLIARKSLEPSSTGSQWLQHGRYF